MPSKRKENHLSDEESEELLRGFFDDSEKIKSILDGSPVSDELKSELIEKIHREIDRQQNAERNAANTSIGAASVGGIAAGVGAVMGTALAPPVAAAFIAGAAGAGLFKFYKDRKERRLEQLLERISQ